MYRCCEYRNGCGLVQYRNFRPFVRPSSDSGVAREFQWQQTMPRVCGCACVLKLESWVSFLLWEQFWKSSESCRVFWVVALEYFEFTGTFTEVKSEGLTVIIPYPNRFVALSALPASKPARDNGKIRITKFGPFTNFNMLHHRRFRLCVFRNSDGQPPHCFAYVYSAAFTSIFTDDITGKKRSICRWAACWVPGEKVA